MRQAIANNTNARKQLTSGEEGDDDLKDEPEFDSETVGDLHDQVRDLTEQMKSLKGGRAFDSDLNDAPEAIKELEHRICQQISTWHTDQEERIRE